MRLGFGCAVKATMAAGLLGTMLMAMPSSRSSLAPEQRKPEVTLRVTTRLVQVSVVVHDKDGRPVTGLSKEDFVLLNEGKAVEIAFFSEESATSLPIELPLLPPNVYSNELARQPGISHNLTIILFDTLNTLFWDQAVARDELIRFLGQIQPNDRIAIFALGGGIRVLHDFSNDAASLVKAIKRYRGRLNTLVGDSSKEASLTGDPVLDALFDKANLRMNNYLDSEWRVENTVNAITTIADYFGTMPGRKNLIWVTGSFPLTYGFDQVVRRGSLMEEWGNYNDPVTRACRAISNADMSIYPVDARGLVGSADILPMFDAATRGTRPPQGNRLSDRISSGFSAHQATIDTMNTFAERTGGRAFYNSNDIMTSIRRAIDDGTATYTLGFYPREDDWNRKFHRLEVKVNRPGVEVRHRMGFYAIPGPKTTIEDRTARAIAAGRAPLEATRMTLRVRLAPPPPAGAPQAFELILDPREITLQPRDGRLEGTLHIAYFQRTSAGKELSTRQEVVKLRLTEDTFRRGLADGLSLSREWQIHPDARQLRFAVCDGASDNIGVISVPLAQFGTDGKK